MIYEILILNIIKATVLYIYILDFFFLNKQTLHPISRPIVPVLTAIGYGAVSGEEIACFTFNFQF